MEEGAPIEGRTEILTENTDFIGLINSYTFAGTDSGYTSQTGASALTPVTRSLQSVLDETVSVKDFGAVGNGTTDDTVAIQRAIREIYVSTINSTYSPVRRIIKFPAGTYSITSNIIIPPNCTLVGEGKNNTIISSNVAVLQTCDSLFQFGGILGTNSATLPSFITIRDMALQTSSVSIPVASLDRAANVTFNRVRFSGGTYGLSVTGSGSGNVEVSGSTFTGAATGTINIADSVGGVVTRSSYFDTIRVPISGAGTTSLTTLANGSGQLSYEIISGSSYRAGTMKYTRGSNLLAFDDDFTEPATTIGANLFAHANGSVMCTTTGSATFKYSIKQFI
jgi:hypothetical protein